MPRHVFLSDEGQRMVSDLARWSDMAETECVEKAIKAIWNAVVLKDGLTSAWVGVMKRCRGILDPATRPDALARLRRPVKVGSPPSAAKRKSRLGDQAYGTWLAAPDA